MFKTGYFAALVVAVAASVVVSGDVPAAASRFAPHLQ
jgi:hypothetical protein